MPPPDGCARFARISVGSRWRDDCSRRPHARSSCHHRGPRHQPRRLRRTARSRRLGRHDGTARPGGRAGGRGRARTRRRGRRRRRAGLPGPRARRDARAQRRRQRLGAGQRQLLRTRRARDHHDPLERQLRPDALAGRSRHRQPLRLGPAARLADQDGREAAQLRHRSQRHQQAAPLHRSAQPELRRPVAEQHDARLRRHDHLHAGAGQRRAGRHVHHRRLCQEQGRQGPGLPDARSTGRQRHRRGLRHRPERQVDLLRVSQGAAVGQVVPGAHHPRLLARGKLRARLDADRHLQALPQPRRLQPQSDRAQGPRRAPRRRSDGAGRRAPRVRAAERRHLARRLHRRRVPVDARR